jgi:hypothetical protein
MKKEVKHYGKTLDQLSEKEQELLVIDTSMSLLLMMYAQGNSSKNKSIPELARKRCFIIADILGWDIEKFSSKMELIEKTETTIYSFDNFLNDHDLNNEIVQTI